MKNICTAFLMVLALVMAVPATLSAQNDCSGVDEYKTYAEGGLYMQGDQVTYQGNLYESVVNNLYNVTPGTAAHWWNPLGACGGGGGNIDPTVSITSPSNGQNFVQASLSAISISISANDSDGTIASSSITVDGNTYSGTSASWTPSGYGSFTINASATDNDGASASASITVTVSEPSAPQPPTISITAPANNSTITQASLSAVNITTSSSDPDGTVTGVSIAVDGQTFNSSSASWTPSAFGTYTITATATDNDGQSTSTTSSVTVEEEVVTPGCNGIEEYKSYAEGGIYMRDDEVSWKGNKYKALVDNLFNVEPDAAAHFWQNLGPCVSNDLPVVSFTSPANGTDFDNLGAITFSVSAADPDGTIASVSISIDGQTFSGTSASWTPGDWGSYTATATAVDNLGGEASASVSITVTDPNGPPPPPPSDVPSRVLVGYWHNWNLSSAPYIRLRDVNPNYNIICIAFAEPAIRDIDNTMVFDPIDVDNFQNEPTEKSRQEFKDDVALLQSQGRKVLLSLGGANGVVHLDNETEKQKFITSMIGLIDTYGFDGVDIDLEGSSLSMDAGDNDFKNPTTPRLVNFIEGMRAVVDHYGNNFVLTSAPETAYVQGGMTAYGGSWGGYLPILYHFRNDLDYVHVQLYNTGSVMALDGQAYAQANSDFIVAMTEMMLEGFPTQSVAGNFPAFRADQVALGLPSVPAAAPAGGYATPAEIHAALDYLTKGISFGGNYVIQSGKTYPELRGMMTWSINWDATGNYAYANTYASYWGGASTANLGNTEPMEERLGSVGSFNAYPNPFSQQLTVRLPLNSGQRTQVLLYNQQGQVLLNEEYTAGFEGEHTLQYNTEALPAGLYILRTVSADGQETRKLIKE